MKQKKEKKYIKCKRQETGEEGNEIAEIEKKGNKKKKN